jgi:hypothetical protein
MKRSDRDRLLREVLADENLAATREASLQQGLVLMRRRRRQRVLFSSVAASTVLVAILALSALPRPAPAPSSEVAAREISAVKVITDEQLLALFPNRTVALIGAPGKQELIFVDRPEPSENERKNR